MEHRKGKMKGKNALLPVLPVRTDNRRNGIFVNTGLGVKDTAVTGLIFITVSDRSLKWERDLGIRDK